MFESGGWQWLVLAAAVIVVLIMIYFAQNRIYKSIPPRNTVETLALSVMRRRELSRRAYSRPMR